MDHDTRPRLNRFLGWFFLIAGFIGAIVLDPWSFSERDPEQLIGNPRMVARYAQAVVLAMGFLQLAVALILERTPIPLLPRRLVEYLTGVGALTYAVGCVLWPEHRWVVPIGAIVCLAGFMVLLGMCVKKGALPEVWVVVPILCFGMLLNVMMGLSYADATDFLPVYLGREDGVRQRMLRLARVAAIALSVVVLLYRDLAERARPQPVVRRARLALWCGAVGMPLILALASYTAVEIKYLLPIPALTMFFGTSVCVVLAYRFASPLELWGWVLVASSMGIGLLMGMYAFDGPLPAPGPLAGYNDFVRRLNRLDHAYCIVFGLLSIFMARESNRDDVPSRLIRGGRPLFVAGSVATMLMLVLVAATDMPTIYLSIGPCLVVVAMFLSCTRSRMWQGTS